jgi:hypothetical protein
MATRKRSTARSGMHKPDDHRHDDDSEPVKATPPLGVIPFEPAELLTPHAEHDRDSLLAHIALSDLVGRDEPFIAALGAWTLGEASPWAILVVRFRDDPDPTTSMETYENVFTSAGTGTMNMVDYFLEMSHGQINVSGSRVFGPYTLDRPRADYVGNVYPQPTGKLNRNGVLDLARATATAAGVDLSEFAGVVVCGTPALDLCGWVGSFAALCDDSSLQPSLLGQEMGHGYGLDHSRRHGSEDDYQDPWDTMSTAGAYMASHPAYGAVGPGLNAWNMRLRGWLREPRVHVIASSQTADELVVLRPLHARELPGTLALQVGIYLVEFRLRERWDAGIPRSCVLIHRAADNRSYLMQGQSGNADLVAGDRFEIGRADLPFGEHVLVEVHSIDEASKTATIHVVHRPNVVPDVPRLEPGQLFGGITVDGGGFIVIGGKVIPVPPRGPIHELVVDVGRLLDATEESHRLGQPAIRSRALQQVVRSVGSVARDIEIVTHTPPGVERILKR